MQSRRLTLVPQPTPGRERHGLLIAIGGAEDKMGDRHVLTTVVERAVRPGGVIALLPTGSGMPETIAATYRRVFESLGAEVRIVSISSRADAADPKNVELLQGASAAFFTGGAQGRIVSLIGGTPLAQAIRRAYRGGMAVAGTSAGASVMCQHMIAQGRSGYAPRRGSVTMAPGLGLTKRLVIDQHFAQRHRIGRLFSAVALNPFLIGVGIDEDTAVVLTGEGELEVIGRGTVTVVDGAHLAYTNIHETPPAAPAAVLGLGVHVLTAGHRYDIDRRLPRWPAPALAVAPPPRAKKKPRPPGAGGKLRPGRGEDGKKR
jgi:cyanophycinase